MHKPDHRHVTLFLLVCVSGFLNIAILNGQGGMQRQYHELENLQHGTRESIVQEVPEWDEIMHTTFVIDQQEEPSSHYTADTGLIVSDVNTDFYPGNSTNATNMNPRMYIHYIESLNVSCPDVGAASGSGFTVNYTSSVANATNFNYVKVYNENYSRIYLPSNASALNGEHAVDIEPENMYFNLSNAVELLENRSIYDGASYLFEFNVSYEVSFNTWEMGVDNPPFILQNLTATSVVNYTQTIELYSFREINLTLFYVPVEGDLLINPRFFINGIELDSSIENNFSGLGLPAWKITAPNASTKISTGNDILSVEFGINTTIGFVDVYNERWTKDMIIRDVDVRARTFSIEILEGSETYLVERVEFNMTDMDFRYVIDHRTLAASTPEAAVAVSNNTYSFYDEELDFQLVFRPNGTRFKVGRIQKATGKVEATLYYRTANEFTLRVLDELRNPIRGAKITLFYENETIRFGTLMAASNPIHYPEKETGWLGTLKYYNMPPGKYIASVTNDGEFVKMFNFTIDDHGTENSFDIVTGVPYQPTLLIAWCCIFGVIALIGIIYIKKQ
ncbi:hypothetical protein GF325_13185 [Candidatus Bathyarchaeota archaeon]|nr:hypothetical protein [Candidatus Bathyarchaeota archaeon]